MGTISNIVVAGPVAVYIAAESEAPPANSIAYGTAWGGNWTALGFTEDGSSTEFNHAAENTAHKVDQYAAPVKSTRASEEVTLKVTLAEATLANLQRAIASVGTLTAGSTESTFEVGANTVRLTHYAVGIEFYGPGTDDDDVRYRRIVLHKAVAQGGAMAAMSRNEKTPLEVTWLAHVDDTQTAGEELYVVIDRQVD